MEWLDAVHPEYVDRLAELAAKGRIEIIGGAFFEPILAMIPSRDRVGQIRSYTRWLQNRLGTTVRGMWVPERVWEQAFTHDLVNAGIEYTILDDFHFKMAGLTDSQLQGYLITEDEGRVLSVFPGSERLRYTIPFASPEETIGHLAWLSEQRPGAVCLFGDDGEKFGTWPETKKHVYEDGWLCRFFDALVANQSWLQVTTPSETIDNVPPVGKVYLPDCSYREMTEWALPTEQLVEYERITHEMHDDARLAALRRFVGGGFWRNFKLKYPEADEMYCRMMMVSRRLQEAIDDGATGKLVEEARTQLYRAQCNCGHWHGAFGGIYLPHLRNAVYRCLIAADEILDRVANRPGDLGRGHGRRLQFRRPAGDSPGQRSADGLDPAQPRRHARRVGRPPHPAQPAGHALAAAGGLSPQGAGRRESAERATAPAFTTAWSSSRPTSTSGSSTTSIRGRASWISSTTTRRRSPPWPSGQATVRSDFTHANYEAKIRRNADAHPGAVGPRRLGLRRARADHQGPDARRRQCDAGDRLSRWRTCRRIGPLHFAVEMNFAGLPAGADDRYFHDARRQPPGPAWREARPGRVPGACTSATSGWASTWG